MGDDTMSLHYPDFLTIAVTPPVLSSAEKEAASIVRILSERRADIVHLRHPGSESSILKEILLSVPSDFRDRITIHDHFSIAAEGLCGGIHLNSRNPDIPEFIIEHKFQTNPEGTVSTGYNKRINNIRISRSCHSAEEIEKVDELKIFDYATLSPVFDSISKRGYTTPFSEQSLRGIISGSITPLIALGGVVPEKFQYLKTLGFRGAAMLGYYAPYFSR